jgi:hypothetical protein
MQYERYIVYALLALVIFGGSAIGSFLSIISLPFHYAILVPIQALFNLLSTALGFGQLPSIFQ